LLKKDSIKNFDNSDVNDDNFKRNLFFTVIFLFFGVAFVTSYVFIKFGFGNEEGLDSDTAPLKIVIPYPNNAINIDDYEILKYRIEGGDNLLNVLIKNVGISNNDAISVLVALKKFYNVSQLKVGQVVEFKYRILVGQNSEGRIDERVLLEEMRLTLDNREKEIVVSLTEDGKYEAKEDKVSINRNFLKYKVTIRDSLFSDGLAAGVPANVMLDFIKFFSFDIDFQRDLREGDTFEVLFESYYTDEGKKVKDGDILYANITTHGKIFEIYKFGNNYYDKNGQSVQKSLLKTPINGARVSSNFGVRRHPILGYSKLHAGKDFAAPIGIPIFAAGSGTIVKAQFWSTWGNYVRIRHTNGYETEYAHASKIASGIKPGVRVRQGQVIAYVGNTGRSTGPHLHFGILYKNTRINPDRVKSLPTVRLIGKDLINFKITKEEVDLYRLNIPNQNLKLKK
jgi:murein DD-endopeptidase MepM/ murein hydrolase activator NlpD